ncbi:MAG: hypothetical protein ACE5H5_02245 [Nitrospinota bacterium]
MRPYSNQGLEGHCCLHFHIISLALLACALLFSLPQAALAQQAPYATITTFSGIVIVRSQVNPPVGEWRRVTGRNHPLFQGDEIKTDTGTAEITFVDDGSLIALDEETAITLEESPKQRKILGIQTDEYISRTIRVARGTLGGDIKEQRDLVTEFASPTVAARVQGTMLLFSVDPTTGAVTVTSTEGILDVISPGGSTLIELSDGGVEVSVDPTTGAVSVTSLSGSHEVQTETGATVSLDEGEGASMTIDPGTNTTGVTATAGEITTDVGGNTVTLDKDECFQAVVEPATGTVDITATCGDIDVNGTLLAEGQTAALPITVAPAPPPGPPPEPIPPERLETTDASPAS